MDTGQPSDSSRMPAPTVHPPARKPQEMPTLLRVLLLPFRVMRWLYQWVVGWADKPAGPIALTAIAFAEASFFPVPPDPLLMALCIGKRRRSFWFSALCTAGSVAGGVFGWMLGKYLFAEVVVWAVAAIGGEASWFGTAASLGEGQSAIVIGETSIYPDGLFWRANVLFDEYGFWAMFMAALTPIPYKVATIASGVFGLGLWPVVIGSVFGRGLRFFAISSLFYFLGDWAKRFIDKHFTWLTIAGGVLLVGGFYVVKFLL